MRLVPLIRTHNVGGAAVICEREAALIESGGRGGLRHQSLESRKVFWAGWWDTLVPRRYNENKIGSLPTPILPSITHPFSTPSWMIFANPNLMTLIGLLLTLREPIPCDGLEGASSSLLVHSSSCLANLFFFYFTLIVLSGPELGLHSPPLPSLHPPLFSLS